MCFIWKMFLRMFIVQIESSRDILLYFCEIGNMKKYRPRSMGINLTNMAPVNGYKHDKYDPCQWV